MLFFTVTRFPASVHIIDVDASAEKKVRRRGVYEKGLTKLHHHHLPVTMHCERHPTFTVRLL